MLEITDDDIAALERLADLLKGHPLEVAETDLKTRSQSLETIDFFPL